MRCRGELPKSSIGAPTNKTQTPIIAIRNGDMRGIRGCEGSVASCVILNWYGGRLCVRVSHLPLASCHDANSIFVPMKPCYKAARPYS